MDIDTCIDMGIDEDIDVDMEPQEKGQRGSTGEASDGRAQASALSGCGMSGQRASESLGV